MKIKLQKDLMWDLKSEPHAIVFGVSGSGKSMMLLYLIREFLKLNSKLFIIDPKIDDLYQLSMYLPENQRAANIPDIIRLLDSLNYEMNKRQKMILDSKRYGITAYDLDLPPIVLFFDELAAASSMLTNKKDKDQYNSLLKNLVLKGRSAGIQLIFSLQQPNANNLPTELREQTNIKIGLGRSTPIATREMVFDKQEDWPVPPEKYFGVGWVKTGTTSLQIYEAPLMENFDVHETIIPLLRKDDYFD